MSRWIERFAEMRANGWERVPRGSVGELAAICHKWDLDVMTEEQLAAFRPQDRRSFKAWARGLFYPFRPIGYLGAARQLITMAAVRHGAFTARRPKLYLRDYEKRYAKLPKFAQWRNTFNVLACVQEGKKFRKRPRRKA